MSKDFEEKVLNKLSELDVIKEKVSIIEEKVSVIDELKREVKLNSKKMDNLDNRLERVEKSLVLMENKLNEDLKAIHEGYILNYELRIEDRKRINSLENSSFDYAIRISNLEDIVDENTKQIKKLMS